MNKNPRRIFIIGYTASEYSGWGIARYTWQLIHNLKFISEMEVALMESGPPSKNTIIRSLEKLAFFYRVLKVKGSLYHAISPILAIPLAVADKSPSVVTVHDLLQFYGGYGKSHRMKIDLAYHAYVFDKLDAIITTAKYWKLDIMRRFSVQDKKICVIYNGVDTTKYKPVEGARSKLLKRVLYVGSPTALRGIDMLIKAFSIVSKECKDVEFIVGGKTSKEHVLRLSKKFNVNVKHVGFVPEEQLPHLYNSAYVFVNPPTDECSLMLLEAMACGTPVIAREIFQMREYLGDAALMVRSEEPDELAEAISKLLTDEVLWFKLSKKGLERAKAFTWRKTAENTYKVYTKLLG